MRGREFLESLLETVSARERGRVGPMEVQRSRV